MKAKEAKKRIEDLENVYDDMIKIQECCLKNEDAKICIKELEEKSNINTNLRNLVSVTASYISDEIRRLEHIIDDSVAKID
ncbi:MAG: hypothetical protein K2L07_16245 [Lachnospiraceae bacterium]|nr:hypothetical protein [Lachnospiraceae bacterium]